MGKKRREGKESVRIRRSSVGSLMSVSDSVEWKIYLVQCSSASSVRIGRRWQERKGRRKGRRRRGSEAAKVGKVKVGKVKVGKEEGDVRLFPINRRALVATSVGCVHRGVICHAV